MGVAGLAAGGLVVGEAVRGFHTTRTAVNSAVRVAEIFTRDDGYNFLRSAERPRSELIPPPEFIGISVNSPFLWKEEDEGKIAVIVGKAKKLGAKSIRIIINDDEDKDGMKKYGLEPKLGEYNPEVIGKIKKFNRIVGEAGGGEIGVVPYLFDGWNFFRSDKWSYSYGRHTPKSPYLFTGPSLEENRVNFFNKREVKERFKARLRYLVDGLKDEKRIIGWGLINEPELPEKIGEEELPEERRREIMTDGYNEYINVIRVRDKRPILTGLARPWYIDEAKIKDFNVINTIHTYPNGASINPDGPLDLDSDTRRRLIEHYNNMRFPLNNEEVGIPDRFVGYFEGNEAFGVKLPSVELPAVALPDDNLTARFMRRVGNLGVYEQKLYIWSYGLWKLDLYEDTYDVDPDTHPEVLAVAGKFGEILEGKIDLFAKIGQFRRKYIPDLGIFRKKAVIFSKPELMPVAA